MARKKGSGKGIALSPKDLEELRTDVLDVGCRNTAAQVGVSANYISMIINGNYKPSPQTRSKMVQAVKNLRSGILTN
jgi:predicted transcriptional regulator